MELTLIAFLALAVLAAVGYTAFTAPVFILWMLCVAVRGYKAQATPTR